MNSDKEEMVKKGKQKKKSLQVKCFGKLEQVMINEETPLTNIVKIAVRKKPHTCINKRPEKSMHGEKIQLENQEQEITKTQNLQNQQQEKAVQAFQGEQQI